MDKQFEEQLSMLFEAVFDIDKDVDYVYDKYFRDILDEYKRVPDLIYVVAKNIEDSAYDTIKSIDAQKQATLYNLLHKFSSTELPSDISKKANEENPVNILAGIQVNTNQYIPSKKLIFLSPNINAITFLGVTGLKNKTSINQYPEIANEFSEENMKSSIAHELSHWMRDSINNKHIQAYLQKLQQKTEKKKPIDLTKHKYFAFHEIDAQIHALKQLKKQYFQTWDEMTMKELLMLKPAIKHSFNKVAIDSDEKKYSEYMKRLFARMTREDLLGKNMRPLSRTEAANL